MIAEYIRFAVNALRRNVFRSLLTVIGVFIGIAAVIVVITLGLGTTANVKAEVAKLGSNLLAVVPGQSAGTGPGARRTDAAPFLKEDAKVIFATVPGVSEIAPTSSQRLQAIARNRNWSTNVVGCDNAFLTVRQWPVVSGREFTPSEQKSGAAVCIIGQTVADELFGSDDPVGERLRLDRLSCEVVGRLATKGHSAVGEDQDDLILIPLNAFLRRVSGDRYIQQIVLLLDDPAAADVVSGDIRSLMRKRRHLAAHQEDNFQIRDPREISEALTAVTRAMTLLLSAVAMISLLVGGIGIMNMMLVSVTERTREIGIRLALGATPQDIRNQFLIEAVILTQLGAMSGLVCGLALSLMLTRLLNIPFVVEASAILGVAAFSVGIGLVFGFLPARRAAQLRPIEALRTV